jgi:hypothetical protein
LFRRREVVMGVVDDVVGSEGANQIHFRRAAHTGDFGAERLRYLDCIGPHATRRTDDQHLLPSLNVSFVVEALEGGHG